MGFKQGQRFAKLWEIEDKGRYSIVNMSTSKKNKDTDKYETDFSCKFVRFIAKAHEMVKKLEKGTAIKILSCEVTNKYDKEKKVEYTNYLVYDFEVEGNSNNSNTSNYSTSDDGFMNIPDGIDEELPFN
jgi:single-strand DNA-binding protein